MVDSGGTTDDKLQGVRCLRCQGELIPIWTDGAKEGFAFGCVNGHLASLQDLFAVQSGILKSSLRTLLASWEEAIRQMVDGAKLADRRGLPELAARLRRRMQNLEERSKILREGFLEADEASPPAVKRRN